MCLILLLFVIWFIRKLIWRVIIICVVLFLLFLIWRWISPSTADNVLNWLQDLPVRATNFVNTDILNKDIVLPLHNPVKSAVENVKESVDNAVDAVDEVVDDVDSTIDELTDVSETAIEDNEWPRYSWLSKLFNDDKSDVNEEVIIDDINNKNSENDNGTTWAKQFVEKRHEWVDLKLSENGEIIIETITSSWEKIIDKVAKVWNWSGDQSTNEEAKEIDKKESNKVETPKNDVKVTVTTKTVTTETKKADTTKKVDSTKEEENEIVYIKSNPKKEDKKTTTTTTTTKTTSATNEAPVKAIKGLTAAEVREANAIFN